jgi:hypothetical protein
MKSSVDIIEYTVEGCGEFPFDMLRYDSCWPYTGDDAAEMASKRYERDTNIQLRRIVLQGINRPTRDRWRSFNWRVVCMGVERVLLTSGDRDV